MATSTVERTRTPARLKRAQGFWSSGDAGVWLTAGATSLSLLLILGVFALVAAGGLGYFWPRPLELFEFKDGSKLLGQVRERAPLPAGAPGHRVEIHGANRDVDPTHEYAWVDESDIARRTRPRDALVVERLEYGPAFGLPVAYQTATSRVEGPDATLAALRAHRPRLRELERRAGKMEQQVIAKLAQELDAMRREEARSGNDALSDRRARLEARYATAEAELDSLRAKLAEESLLLRTADGQEIRVTSAAVVRAFAPNRESAWGKFGIYLDRGWEFVSGHPREANTEGGILPAIFGTVLMVLLMTIAVVPLGVLAALYLREYAHQGALVRGVRIAVNNLAGVPSIVFGIFGLGFFVYFVGGGIDHLFFADRLPSPTFGTGGILWSALTLALLTLPVVIVATEEGLAAVPRATREGSLALGATKWETTWRVVLPAASPGILTGVILAMARAAGEVAPLMLTGAVKIASDLPLSRDLPFLHLERKFMHLGFHIFDVGFQSPNVEAAKPMVYMTTFLLVALVVALNLLAMTIRNRLRARYRSASF
ncbi:MAG: phosphate ABC transporter permease PstA [Candidatus Eisenbacteria bacterium]